MNKIRLDNKQFYYQVFYKENKNMYLRLKGSDQLIVTCNRRVSVGTIETFIKHNKARILRAQDKLESKLPLYNDQSMLIFGNTYPITYEVMQKRNSYQFKNDVLEISFKGDHFDTKYLESIYKDLLIDKIYSLLPDLKQRLEAHFNIDKVIYKAQLMRSRYGSCIPQNRIIKLNTILARFDPIYLETILIHELIHLKVHNHQKTFYRYIDTLVPNYRQIHQNLKKLTGGFII